jgi:hypothetical protein
MITGQVWFDTALTHCVYIDQVVRHMGRERVPAHVQLPPDAAATSDYASLPPHHRARIVRNNHRDSEFGGPGNESTIEMSIHEVKRIGEVHK